MANVGYARASTVDQDLSIQIAALKAAGCDPIRSEKRSGTTVAGRDELRTVLDFLREGDTLTITRIDRLARSIGDLQDIVRELRAKGVKLKATEQPINETSVEETVRTTMANVGYARASTVDQDPSIQIAWLHGLCLDDKRRKSNHRAHADRGKPVHH